MLPRKTVGKNQERPRKAGIVLTERNGGMMKTCSSDDAVSGIASSAFLEVNRDTLPLSGSGRKGEEGEEGIHLDLVWLGLVRLGSGVMPKMWWDGLLRTPSTSPHPIYTY